MKWILLLQKRLFELLIFNQGIPISVLFKQGPS